MALLRKKGIGVVKKCADWEQPLEVLNKFVKNIFVAEFNEGIDNNGKECVEIFINGQKFGDPIRDNHYEDDYYRYHDLFHFSYVTVLGWSPTARALMHKKKRSNDLINEIEDDGGRAIVIDEAISALVFEHARNHNFYDGIQTIDEQLLHTIR